ncbi:hypothetical protein [Lysinibacillus fusiformis]|uniref:hypothetical protein n=1 Tax=Lysinibacillus fusiformis TaxID=28031 RepID=UPI0020BF4141|nr:hypothetical protein [Lysinibacillus fusiformis]
MAYYDVLDKAHTTEDYGDIVELIEKEVEASLDLYTSAVWYCQVSGKRKTFIG